MGHHKHRADAGQTSVSVHVVVVSTSRDQLTDRSGPVLIDALVEAGHQSVGRRVLPDDGALIQRHLKEVAAAGRAQVVILSGGTGISKRDGTYEAVSSLLDKELPGFGELFRMLSFQEIGAAAMLSRATAGVWGDLVLFALPGSPAACRLAMQQLILPELRHLVHELAKEPAPEEPMFAPSHAPAPFDEPPHEELEEEDADDPSTGVRQIGMGQAPPEPDYAAPEVGWLAAVADWQGVLQRGRAPELPVALRGMASVTDVLNTAGERGRLLLADGEVCGLYGYPDLRRPGSKVLMVSEGEPFAELIPLHRYPQRVGVSRKGGGRTHSTGRMSRTALEITGQDYPNDGRLFACDSDLVYVLDSGTVWSWDGRRTRNEGTPSSVLGSLLLRWTQR